MRVVCISDTHSRHRTISGIPHGDVLVHAGDCTGNGSLSALEDFTQWLASWPHEYKILIAGNHDYCFERHPQESRDLCNKCGITYLEDEQVTIRGHIFFGSPWTPVFRKMAFNADEAELSKLRARIPDSVTVLVTHGPAWRIFDYVPREAVHVGCYSLMKKINNLPNLRAHVCGHIHESYGYAVRESDGVKFVNASICDERYLPINTPIIIEL